MLLINALINVKPQGVGRGRRGGGGKEVAGHRRGI